MYVHETHDETRLRQLDIELAADAAVTLPCEVWEMKHRERVEICRRLGINPTSRQEIPSGTR